MQNPIVQNTKIGNMIKIGNKFGVYLREKPMKGFLGKREVEL